MKRNLQSMRQQDVPLHAEVAAVLRHQILSGDLPYGSKLPALRELTETLGVARMTIIQAMNTLEDEGLIERYSGRGTFVQKVCVPERYKLQMHAEISQIYAMVSQLQVDVKGKNAAAENVRIEDRAYRLIKRTHLMNGKPFCQVAVHLDQAVFDLAPKRFLSEIAVSVLEDLGVEVISAKQKITISHADFDLAASLGIQVNSAVFRVVRQFFDGSGNMIYSALLVYPGDLLELEIDVALPMKSNRESSNTASSRLCSSGRTKFQD